jgi:glycerate dehydrogenase
VLSQVDVLSLHCPLTPRTQGLIGASQLARMKPDALLINTARGALVDSLALAEALRAGRLGGAAIDVLTQEPPVDGDPCWPRTFRT